LNRKPEEVVRQALLVKLEKEYGFPSSCLVVEKKLSLFPHIKKEKVPDRRCDIVAFANDIHEEHAVYPLLLIECKHTHLTQDVVEQVVGYNYYMGAYFIALANLNSFLLGWQEEKQGLYQWQEGLISYNELVAFAKKYRKSVVV
jgi:hypothetical protein